MRSQGPKVRGEGRPGPAPLTLPGRHTDLVNRMTEGQLTQRGHGEGLAQQMRAQEVRVVLVHQELRVAHPRLSQQPVPVRVSGQKDRAIGPGGLAELRSRIIRG